MQEVDDLLLSKIAAVKYKKRMQEKGEEALEDVKNKDFLFFLVCNTTAYTLTFYIFMLSVMVFLNSISPIHSDPRYNYSSSDLAFGLAGITPFVGLYIFVLSYNAPPEFYSLGVKPLYA